MEKLLGLVFVCESEENSIFVRSKQNIWAAGEKHLRQVLFVASSLLLQAAAGSFVCWLFRPSYNTTDLRAPPQSPSRARSF